MDKVTLYIPYPEDRKAKTKFCSNYGMNAYYSGKHWTVRKQDAEHWHKLTWYAATQATGYTPKLFDKPVIVRFYWHDGLDIDNHAVMGKMIVDGLKDLLIKDDTKKYVRAVEHYFRSDFFGDLEKDCIIVEIEEFTAHCVK